MFDQFTAFRFLRRVSHSPVFWLGGPLLLYVWAIPGPFVFDDLNLLRKTEQYNRGERESLELFSFAPTHEDWLTMRSRGTYPWWAPETHRIDFQRPIPQWSFWLDVRIFGRNPIGSRIESLALFLIALLLIHRMFRSFEPDPLRAGLATFLLGVSQCLAQPVAFISNRSDLFVLIGLAIAATAWSELRKRSSAATLLAGIAGFVVALLSKEPAVAFAAVIVGHAVLASRRKTSPAVSAAQKWFAVATAVVAACYLGWYFQTSRGSAGTFDLERLMSMGRGLLLYATVWGIGVPVAIMPQLPTLVGSIVVAAGAISWIAIAWIVFRQMRERREGVLFFTLWMTAFIAPGLLTIPESRALSIATVGWAWLLAGFLLPRASNEENAPDANVWMRQWFLATNGIVSVCCGIGTIYMMNHFEMSARSHLRTVAEALDPPLADGETIILLEAESPYQLICAGDRLSLVTNRRDVRAVFLTLRGAGASVQRVSPREYLIEGNAPALFDTPTHALTLGSSYRPAIGDRFELRDFTIDVAALNDAGDVTKLRLTINDDVDPDTLRFAPPEAFDAASGGARGD